MASSRGIRVLFMHSGDRVPSSRFRVLPFAKRLRKAGYHCTLAGSFPQKYEYFPWLGFRPSQLLKRGVRVWHLIRARLRPFHVIVIDREIFDNPTTCMEDRFRRLPSALVMDVDDAVFLRFPEKSEYLARMADHYVAGNQAIADYARPFNDRITIIPTCVELDDFQLKEYTPPSGGPTIVGWIGTQSNVRYLNVVLPALRRLSQRHRIQLRIVTPDAKPVAELPSEGIDVRFVPWRGDTEVSEIQKFDIGLMPLHADEDWTRFKCNTKLLQYMAVGVSPVGSLVGMNTEILEHGLDGYLAANDDQWEQHIETLVLDPAKRISMGQLGRRKVDERYSVAANLPRYIHAFDQAMRFRRGEALSPPSHHS